MALHKNLSTGDIHVPYQWTYADAAARTGASGFVAGDVGKFARQLDDNSIWVLSATTPTWVAVGGGGDAVAHADTTGQTANDHHNEAHTVASHSDTSATGAELNALTNGSNADTLHAHAFPSVPHSATTGQTANDHHNESHTVASHSDTSATGSELNELTNGSETTLHSHAGGGSVFGAGFQEEVSLGRSTTTSSSFQNKLTLTTPALTGKYRVGWHAVVDQSLASDAVQAQLYNNTNAQVVGTTQEHEPKDTKNRIAVGGFEYIDFTGSAKSFTIQYRQQRGSTAGIQDARIEIWRVS